MTKAHNFLRLYVYSLLLYMPFHLFLSRWLSLYTGGLGQWDAAKDILTVIALGVAISVAIKEKLFKKRRLIKWIFILSGLYALLHLIFLFFHGAGFDFRSYIVATLFNGRIFAYLFIAFVIAATQKLDTRKLLKIVLIASTITCLFALIQYVAPKDLMEHFGYSIERGAKPNFFIDDKPDFPRVMSTVRDPNSYGAFLILPITILSSALIKGWNTNRRLLLSGLLLLHVLALFLTFSRGAWLGLIVTIGSAVSLVYKRQIIAFIRKHLLIVVGIFILMIGSVAMFQDSYVFQNVIFHSDKNTVLADPNELRITLQKKSIQEIAEDPEGHAPGTAGIVSIGNPHGTVLTENYFLQVAYEVGLIGLLLFLALNALVAWELFKISQKNWLAAVMLASFIGYAFISLLIHLWSNEAVAAQWWLLAGIVIAQPKILRSLVALGGKS